MGQGGSIKQQHREVDPEVTFTAGFGSSGVKSQYKILKKQRVYLDDLFFKFPISPSILICQLLRVFVEQPCVEFCLKNIYEHD